MILVLSPTAKGTERKRQPVDSSQKHHHKSEEISIRARNDKDVSIRTMFRI